MGWLNVYVPRPEHLTWIAKGSGIVGVSDDSVANTQRVHIYYEGNLYDAVNMRKWSERVFHAASRSRTNYPTMAQAWVEAADLIYIGAIDDAGHIDLIDSDDPKWSEPESVAYSYVEEWLKGPGQRPIEEWPKPKGPE